MAQVMGIEDLNQDGGFRNGEDVRSGRARIKAHGHVPEWAWQSDGWCSRRMVMPLRERKSGRMDGQIEFKLLVRHACGRVSSVGNTELLIIRGRRETITSIYQTLPPSPLPLQSIPKHRSPGGRAELESWI